MLWGRAGITIQPPHPSRACTSHLQWKSLSARWPPIPGKVADSVTGSKLDAKVLPLTPRRSLQQGASK